MRRGHRAIGLPLIEELRRQQAGCEVFLGLERSDAAAVAGQDERPSHGANGTGAFCLAFPEL
jgi:hypothetical protein